MKETMNHYSRLILILVWSFWFGVTLFLQTGVNNHTVILFEHTSLKYVVSILLMLLPIIKTISVIIEQRKGGTKTVILFKKWSLIFIATLWLVIACSYALNEVANSGFITSSFIAVNTYIEIGRSDFSY